MYLMIDNFDSFVYNLKAYFEEMGRCVTVKRCDRISLHDVEDLEPEGIILSPGPGRPWRTNSAGSQRRTSADSIPRRIFILAG